MGGIEFLAIVKLQMSRQGKQKEAVYRRDAKSISCFGLAAVGA